MDDGGTIHGDGGLAGARMTPPPTSPPAGDSARPAAPPEPDSSGAIDILAGLLFAAFGVAALFVGRDYVFGTTLRMGPGFMPRIVAAILVLLGVVMILRGMMIGGWRPPSIAWRPILLISAAIIAFALTIDRFGLVIASLLTVAIGACAETGVRWRQLPLIAFGLAAFAAILFGYALRLSMPIWPR